LRINNLKQLKLKKNEIKKIKNWNEDGMKLKIEHEELQNKK